MKKTTENFYKKLIIKHSHQENTNEYLKFCLNYIKENIVECYNTKSPCKDVVVQLFKRGMAKKWLIDHPNWNSKNGTYEVV